MTPAEAYIAEKHLQQDYEDFLENYKPAKSLSPEEKKAKREQENAHFEELKKKWGQMMREDRKQRWLNRFNKFLNKFVFCFRKTGSKRK